MNTYTRRSGRFGGLILGTLLLLTTILGAADPVFAATLTAVTTAPLATALSPDAESVALGINRSRINAGLPALAIHPLLNQAAQTHVNDMVANRNYSHWGSDGSDVRARVARTGYAADGWSGENWVAVSDAANALSWWLNSSVHRANILNPNWKELGIGSAPHPDGWGTIYVAVFTRGSVNQAGGAVPGDPNFVSRTVQTVPTGGLDYVIRPGDTLSAIAARHGLAWQDIASANGLGEYSVLNLGQVIRLPGVRGATPGNASPAAPGNSVVVSSQSSQYAVRAGDTLLAIALNHGMTWQEIAAANNMTGNELLQIGQTLRIPSYGASGATAVSTTYTIHAGDTIIAIAIRYGLDWQHLLTINGFSENTMLHIGQVIRLN